MSKTAHDPASTPIGRKLMTLKTMIMPSVLKTEPAMGLEMVWLTSACSQPALRKQSAASAGDKTKASSNRALVPRQWIGEMCIPVCVSDKYNAALVKLGRVKRLPDK
jgi:hypothetical protein